MSAILAGGAQKCAYVRGGWGIDLRLPEPAIITRMGAGGASICLAWAVEYTEQPEPYR